MVPWWVCGMAHDLAVTRAEWVHRGKPLTLIAEAASNRRRKPKGQVRLVFLGPSPSDDESDPDYSDDDEGEEEEKGEEPEEGGKDEEPEEDWAAEGGSDPEYDEHW